jgi:hypothetical protein
LATATHWRSPAPGNHQPLGGVKRERRILVRWWEETSNGQRRFSFDRQMKL